VTTSEQLAALEAAYLEARTARDHLDVARARGLPGDTGALEAASAAAFSRVHAALAALGSLKDPAGLTRIPDLAAFGQDDRRALATMREGIATAETYALPGVEPDPVRPASTDGAPVPSDDTYDRLVRQLDAAFSAASSSLAFDGEPLTRLQVLARLTDQPDAGRRHALFLALEPLWQSVDGAGDDRSPYAALIRESAGRWQGGHSPIEANAAAMGVTAAEIEGWAVTTLDAWRTAFVEPARAAGAPPVEPWDWWWLAGEAHRMLAPALPLDALMRVNRAVHASLGADLEELSIVFDIHPRPGRRPVPVAYTTFDGRPHRRADGTWSTGRPTIMEACIDGGLGELTELIHETGHAIHIAGIRTRPAFTDWPDSDALTEALAELVALDATDPAWQRRWLPHGASVPGAVATRGRYAEIALDAAWALLEIRLHARPDSRPNDVWTEITSEWLGIAPHPEWSWWAMRGQLVEAPGYMANYAIGAVVAEDLRAAIRAERGDWIEGDPGWYPWVREHVYRFGLERSTRDVLLDVLGRPPNADALLRHVSRAGAGRRGQPAAWPGPGAG
jgi:hypothetical protein